MLQQPREPLRLGRRRVLAHGPHRKDERQMLPQPPLKRQVRLVGIAAVDGAELERLIADEQHRLSILRRCASRVLLRPDAKLLLQDQPQQQRGGGGVFGDGDDLAVKLPGRLAGKEQHAAATPPHGNPQAAQALERLVEPQEVRQRHRARHQASFLGLLSQLPGREVGPCPRLLLRGKAVEERRAVGVGDARDEGLGALAVRRRGGHSRRPRSRCRARRARLARSGRRGSVG